MKKRSMSPRTRRLIWLALIVAVLVVAYAVRVWRLETESIWHDEGWSIRALRSPFGTPDDNTPYAYYATMHLLWKLGVGESVFALRYGSVLIGLLTVALTLRIGWRWLGSWAAIVAGGLVATSPLLWDYAQEVRAYVAVPTFGLALLWLADILLAYKNEVPIPRKWWALLLGVEVAGIYTHNLVIPMIVWLNVAVGLAWLLRKAWHHLVAWAFIQSLMVLCYLPWLATQSPSGTPLNSTPTLGWTLTKDIWRSYFLPVLPQLQEVDSTRLIDGFGLLLILSLLVLVGLERNRRTWLLVSHVIMVPFLSAVLIIVAHIDFHPRYFVAGVPVALLALVAGIAALRKVIGDELPAVIMAGVLAIGLLISQQSLHDISTTRTYQHDDFEALARYYADLPANAVIVIPFGREPALQDYYADKFDIQARFINIPLYSREDQALTHLRRLTVAGEHRPLEFLTWFQLPADVRGMYPCILTASSTRDIEPPHTFYGLATQQYEFGQNPVFEPIVARPVYEMVQFQRIDRMTSPQGMCLRSDWRLLQTNDQKLHMATDLLTEAGLALDRSDVELARQDQVTSEAWAVGDSGSAYQLLQLPPGAPRDDYEVQFSLYTIDEPNGLRLLGDSVGVMGTTYALPETMILSGPIYRDAPATSVVLDDNVTASGILNGTQPLQVTVLIANVTSNPFGRVSVYLRGVDEEWEVRRSGIYSGSPTLSWQKFEIPPDVNGQAELLVEDKVIGTYTIQQIERLFDAPNVGIEVDEKFPGVGNLIGVEAETTITLGNPYAVTLVWQANTATDLGYTVFVQLLGGDGTLIAQSDSPPVQGTRPTTNWVPGEFILDNHTLTFRVNNYEGDATLIAGFYDPATGTRVMTGEGADAAQIPVTITVHTTQ